MEFTLFLIRHGETEHNKGGVIQGQLDIPLSTNGINQAKLLAKLINSVKWKEIWTSDLKRSWQTANFLISTENKDNLDNEVLLTKPSPSIQSDIRIRERHYGVAQGQSTSNLQKLAGKAGIKISHYVPPEAESPTDVRNRAVSFFKDLCNRQLLLLKENEESNILLVGHGGWLREFMTYLSQTERSSFTSYEMESVTKLTPNTAVSRFEIRLESNGEVSSIKCLGLHDRSHLISPASCDELAV